VVERSAIAAAGRQGEPSNSAIAAAARPGQGSRRRCGRGGAAGRRALGGADWSRSRWRGPTAAPRWAAAGEGVELGDRRGELLRWGSPTSAWSSARR
jgi:hypothetical protein